MLPRGQKRLLDGRSILHVDPANLKPEEVEVLYSLETIWDDPNVLEKLRTFKWIFDLLLSACKSPEAGPTVSATYFDSVIAAKEAVGVDYHQHGSQHDWQPRESSDLIDGRLSQWAAITTSKYFERSESESICRTVIDVIFCD
ncbi:hypothetical protein TSTA_037390 [Talaromyces stipitatus ATCC 10500]|uniref:Uncharacterized protein n=1 Tax=Talaromyces stipitatus (strain ATCC 10500 / CBS 375.48 / QM 6759 / NRRL 1006) TaxID=441959 RepID=B8M8K6_TALSN|nr:uncharacterized protein TSTA_037390 [Talaromyces stipitatus ATCC 10500]EED20518.1 hypothetical protein TSTA_037390 [Talaromyces stipitatus ATCC 10500]